MYQTPLWKPIFIVVALGLCGLMLYPPSKKLKPGLDLVGGTTLTYQVDVPEGMDSREAIDQIIASYQKRVDPQGVRNLVWRPLAGNRFEVQMPLSSTNTRQLRDQYVDLLEAVGQRNLDERQLERAVAVADAAQRDELLAKLAAGNPALREKLADLAAAHDARAAAQQPVQQLDQQLQAAQDALDQLPADAPADKKQQAQDALTALRKQLQEKVPALLAVEEQYTAAREAVLGSNVDVAELERVVSVPNTRAKDAREGDPTLREAALNKLIAAHPQREADIRAVAAAYEAYEKVKGPLDDASDLITMMRGSGVLEFRIAATASSVPDVNNYRQQLREKGPRAGGDRPWKWMQVDRDENGNPSFTENARQRAELEQNPEAYFAGRGLIGQLYAGEYYVLMGNAAPTGLTRAQPGWELSRAFPTMDESGFPAVSFALNAVGGGLMAQLTGNHIGQPMGICLDGRVMSAPRINDKIHGSGIITGGSGGFGARELDYLIRTLNAGTLAAAVSEQPISVKTIGPQLGQDNLHAGLNASKWSLIAVSVFMIVYYFFGGIVAVFALLANMVVILGVMCLLEATWTLPGIAGIVLTIGMAVDANVLIFERIREELQAGEPMHVALRRGYEKAFSTILDANITTIITCVVLYYTATTEIKGFALTLGIGIAATMFTALFCTRVIFDWYFRFTGARTLPSLPMVVPAVQRALSPNVDWMKKLPVFMVISALLIAGSYVAIALRGADMLDIEFRSGTEVGFELREGETLTLSEARERMDKVAAEYNEPRFRGSGTGARILTVGRTDGDRASAFSIQTLVEDPTLVSKVIKQAFLDKLDTQVQLEFQGVEQTRLADAPVYPINSSNLGEVVHRSIQEDVSEYLGGVAILLEDLKPATTEADLAQRIKRMRLQPSYETLGFRQFDVIGVTLAGVGAEPTYSSAVVVVRDQATNYIDDPAAFTDDPQGLATTEWSLVRDALTRDTSLASVSSFSSQISGAMQAKAGQALFLSLMAVVLYVWLRFGRLGYGLAAIAALVHDVSIALGLIAVSYLAYHSPIGDWLLIADFKINLAMVAALLTLVGYSLNDTIVVFDRIRENRGRLAFATPEIINRSINQTLSRTTMTSFTTLIAVFVLYELGGEGVHGFAFGMFVGIVVGTYSSIAIAAPLLLVRLKKAGAGGASNAPAPVR